MQEYQSPARTELCGLVQVNNGGVDSHIVTEICGTLRMLEEQRVVAILDILKKQGELITAERVLSLLTE